MEPANPSTKPTAPSPPPAPKGPGHALFSALRTRIFSGLLLALPVVITIWIIYWLYSTLQGFVLDPLAHLVTSYVMADRLRGELPFWWTRMVAPAIAIAIVLVFLYFLGHLVHTRLARSVDWMLSRVPLVTIVYKAVRNVFQAIGDQNQSQRFKRVVLVEFPHPGMRALAFVTKSLQDTQTGRTILCVCVLTGVVPPAGFTLFVPEDDVIDVDWSVNQTLQAILSGGITSPAAIQFFRDRHPHAHPPGGPIIDTHGHPLHTLDPSRPGEDGP